MSKSYMTMLLYRWTVALVACAFAQSCGPSSNEPAVPISDIELAKPCEIESEQTKIEGVLHWGPPGHHGESIWLQRVQDQSLVTLDNQYDSPPRIDEVYAVRLDQELRDVLEAGPKRNRNSIVLVGTWRGRAGTIDPSCYLFKGDAELYENRAIDLERVENLRVLE